MNSLYHRVSIRKYQDKAVEPEKIESMLKAAMQSPSACNQQPWEFYVVTDKERLKKLSEASPYAKMTANAPAAIVIAYREDIVAPMMAVQDASIATTQLWLECDNQGLGGVWLGIAPLEDRMKATAEAVGMPPEHKAFAIFPFGYPAEERNQQDRFDQSKVHYL
jgi:nitroreductase